MTTAPSSGHARSGPGGIAGRTATPPGRRPVAVTVAAGLCLVGGVAVLGLLSHFWVFVIWGGAGTALLAAPVAGLGVALLAGGLQLLSGRSALTVRTVGRLSIAAGVLGGLHFADVRWAIVVVGWAVVLGLLAPATSRAWFRAPHADHAAADTGPNDPEGVRRPRGAAPVDRSRVAAAATALGAAATGLTSTWRLAVDPTVQWWLASAPGVLTSTGLIAGAVRLLARGSAGPLAGAALVIAAVTGGALLGPVGGDAAGPEVLRQLAVGVVAPMVVVFLLAQAHRRMQVPVDPAAHGSFPAVSTAPAALVGVAVAAFAAGATHLLRALELVGSGGVLRTAVQLEAVALVALAAGLTAGGVLLLVRRRSRVLTAALIGMAALPFVPLGVDPTYLSLLGLILPGVLLALLHSAPTRWWTLPG